MKVIIPCGRAKRNARSRARDLYTGAYFKMTLKYALSVAHETNVFVLSAKHGLVALTHELEPYNLLMGEPGSVGADVVASQAKALGLVTSNVYAIAGRKYLKVLRAAGVLFCAPLSGDDRRMGIQMGLLKKNMGRVAPWKAWEG